MTRESPVMAIRDDEAEMAVVEVDETSATFRLDDGERLVFDLTELRAAIAAPASGVFQAEIDRVRRPDAAGGADLEARR